MEQLAMYISTESSLNRFENSGRKSMINLTNDLYLLSGLYFKNMSIMQFRGDGFLIKETSGHKLEVLKFIDISVALLQLLTLKGSAGRIQISLDCINEDSGFYNRDILNKIMNKFDDLTEGRCEIPSSLAKFNPQGCCGGQGLRPHHQGTHHQTHINQQEPVQASGAKPSQRMRFGFQIVSQPDLHGHEFVR